MKKLNLAFLIVTMASGFVFSQSYDFPESVVYDHVNGQYLVSNSGNGTIVASDLNNNLSDFISSGLNSPKDMHIGGNSLFVTDGNDVHIIDLSSATITQTVTVIGAQELTGITGNSDSLFVVDFQGDKIYYVSTDGTEQDLLSDSWTLDHCYSILLDHMNRLIVISNRPNSAMQFIKRDDGTVDFNMGTGLSNLSGIVQSAANDYYMATQSKDAVYRFTDPTNPPLYHDDAEVVVAEGFCSDPGFIYFCDVNNVLAVPSGPDNTVHFISADHLSVNEPMKDEVVIAPNPGGENVTIHVPAAYVQEGNYAEVYTLAGQRVHTLALTQDEVHLSGLPAGVYMVRFTINGESQASRKVIIQ